MTGKSQWCHKPNCEGSLDLVSEKMDGSITHLLFRCSKCGAEKSQAMIHGEGEPSARAGQTTADEVPAEDVSKTNRRLRSEREKGL